MVNKNLFIIFITLFLLTLTNAYADLASKNLEVTSHTANQLNVTWYPIEVGLVNKQYNISVENLAGNRDELLEVFFSALSAEVVRWDTVVLEKWDLVEKTARNTSEICYPYNVIEIINGTSYSNDIANCTTLDNGAYNYTIFDWKKIDLNETKMYGKNKFKNKNGNEHFNPNSKKWFRLSFMTRLRGLKTNEFGSEGKIGVEVNNEEYHPFWNTSCTYRIQLNVTERNNTLLQEYPVEAAIGTNGSEWAINTMDVVINNENTTRWRWKNFGSASSILYWNTNVSAGATQSDYVYYNCTGFNSSEKNVTSYAPGVHNNGNLIAYYPFLQMGDTNLNATAGSKATSASRLDVYNGEEGVAKMLQGVGRWGSSDVGFNNTRYSSKSVGLREASNQLITVSGGKPYTIELLANLNVDYQTTPRTYFFLHIGGDGVSCGACDDWRAGNSTFGTVVSTAGTSPLTTLQTDTNGTNRPGLYEWFHVSWAVSSTGNLRLGINNFSGGLFQVNTTVVGAALTVNNKFYFGSDNDPNNSQISEKFIDEIVIWNESRSADKMVPRPKPPNVTVGTIEGVIVSASNMQMITSSCTAENSAVSSGSYSESCDAAYPGDCSTNSSKDFLACNDGNTESQAVQKGKYGGVHEQVYNGSVNNCQAIKDVFLCYEQWLSAGTPSECIISVDANGNGSYSNVSTTCPGISADPGMTCANVTSLEVWNCNSFFDATGTKAVAKNEITRTDAGGATNLMTDALFFNISYDSYVLDQSIPRSINLINPANNTMNASRSHVFFANATDTQGLQNATLYHNISGNYTANQTVNVVGLNANASFSVYNIYDGGYIWNVKWCDNSNNCAFGNRNSTFTVRDNVSTITYVRINSTDPTTNDTNVNITLFLFNATDVDGDMVRNVTNWYRDGDSLTILNMPFETNVLGNSSIMDYSGRGHNGTPVNNTVWQSNGHNIRGGSYRFDGNGDYIHIAQHKDFAFTHRDNFTITVWVNATDSITFTILSKSNITAPGGQGIPNTYDLYLVNMDNPGFQSPGFNFVGDDLSNIANVECPNEENSVAFNRSQFIAVRWETINTTSANLSMWINGRLCGSYQNTVFVSNWTMPLLIGHNPLHYDGGPGFKGTIDELMIFNHSLSGEQILALNSSNGVWESIVAQETGTAGENWSACVTPCDGAVDGARVCSANFTIR